MNEIQITFRNPNTGSTSTLRFRRFPQFSRLKSSLSQTLFDVPTFHYNKFSNYSLPCFVHFEPNGQPLESSFHKL